jgi:hypothetical protein
LTSFKELVENTKRYLIRRSQAYRIVFAPGQMTDVVLADLAKFCRADRSTFHPDPRVAAQLDGRREVWLRITQHLEMSPEDLYRLLSGMKE